MPQIKAYITLDGQPVLDFNYLEREVERLSESEVFHGIDLSRVRNRANSFVFPRGFDPGRGYVLMERKDCSELSLNTADHKLKFVAGGTIEFQKLLITAIEEITGTDQSNPRSCCLVELADLRVLGSLTSIDKSYNVSIPDESDYFAATLNGGIPWTYESLINDIWSLMPSAFGSLGTGVANFPSGKPENYVFRGCSAWDALRKVVEDINHILTLTRSGSFGIVDCATSPGDYESDRDSNKVNILCGSHDFNLTAAIIPEKVRVFFPRRNKAWQMNSDGFVMTFKDHWQTSPLYSLDVDISTIDADLDVIAGTIHPIHDTLQALYDETGSLTNSTALSNRANEVSSAYIKSLDIADSPSNYRYTGARSFSPDADLTAVAYYDFGYGIITETRGTDRVTIPSAILSKASALARSAGGDPFTNNSGPHLTQPHLDTERFVIATLQANLGSNSSASARVQYGTGSPITWNDASSPTRTITVFNITTTEYSSGTRVVCWFHQQNEKWIAVTSAGAATLGIPFLNLSGETIPPGGIMDAFGDTEIGGIPYHNCYKPGLTIRRRWLVNGSTSIPYNSTGLGSWLDDLSGFAAFDIGSLADLSPGLGWGPIPGSWLLYPNLYGFTVTGSHVYYDGVSFKALFRQHEVNHLKVKLLENLTSGSFALARHMYRNGFGAFVESPFTSELVIRDGGYLRPGEFIASGPSQPIIADIHWLGSFWELTNAQCAPQPVGSPSGSQNSPALYYDQAGPQLGVDGPFIAPGPTFGF